jgi:hypothetical protein
LIFYIRGLQIFQKTSIHLKIPGTRRVTWRKFHTEDPQTLGVTVQIVVAIVTWCPWFVHSLYIKTEDGIKNTMKLLFIMQISWQNKNGALFPSEWTFKWTTTQCKILQQEFYPPSWSSYETIRKTCQHSHTLIEHWKDKVVPLHTMKKK